MQFLATQCYSVQCFLHSLRLPRTTYSQQKRNSKKPKKQFSEGLGGGTLLSQESDLFVFLLFSRVFGFGVARVFSRTFHTCFF